MKTYIKFLITSYLKSFLNIFLIMITLVFILNILKEIEFFNNVNVSPFYPVFLSILRPHSKMGPSCIINPKNPSK